MPNAQEYSCPAASTSAPRPRLLRGGPAVAKVLATCGHVNTCRVGGEGWRWRLTTLVPPSTPLPLYPPPLRHGPNTRTPFTKYCVSPKHDDGIPLCWSYSITTRWPWALLISLA